MASDDINVRLIEDFRPRLREHIVVDQVLDYIHFLDTDQKERIRLKARNEGDIAASNELISAVIRAPHSPGWFREFVDALRHSGCEYAADYIEVILPEPEVEAENDYCVRLIQILSPSLMDMKTEEVCTHCLSEDLLTPHDAEIVSTLM